MCLMLTVEDNVCSGEGPLIDIQLIITSFAFIIQSGTHVEDLKAISPFSGNMCPEDTSTIKTIVKKEKESPFHNGLIG